MFKTAGESENKNSGIKPVWRNLMDGGCPFCADELVVFDHLSLLKCACGFKISNTKFDEIVNSLYQGDEESYNSGYRIGNYHDESPF